MKVCYIDESGAEGQSQCVVMVGVLVDALRLNRTRLEFAGIFEEAQQALGGPISELKGTKILYGRDRWKALKDAPQKRQEFIRRLCRWATQARVAVRADPSGAGTSAPAVQLLAAGAATRPRPVGS